MALIAMTLSDLQGDLQFETLSTPIPRKIRIILCLPVKRRAHAVCNFNLFIETEDHGQSCTL